PGVSAGRTVPLDAPARPRKLIDEVEVCPLHPLNDKLSDPVAAAYLRRRHSIMVHQVHHDLTAVPGIHRSGCVQHGHTDAGGEPGAGMPQPSVPLRQRDRDPGTHQATLARWQLHVVGRHQIGARVARMGVCRHRQIRIEPAQRDRHGLVVHALHPAVSTPQIAPYSRSVAQAHSSHPLASHPLATARYGERLRVPWWLWLPILGLATLLSAEVYLGAPGRWTWVPYAIVLPTTVAGLWALGRLRVAVEEGELRVDDARLPVRYVAGVTV